MNIVQHTYSHHISLLASTISCCSLLVLLTIASLLFAAPSNAYSGTGITDERGVRYATWTYDTQGRTISSQHAGGADNTSLVFNPDGSIHVTNALEKQTTYSFTMLNNVPRVTMGEGHPTASCAGAN
jgi:YD repeat-containing protein